MYSKRGSASFPSVFLTFSLLLLVLAAGFAVGRLVIGRAYLKSAGQFEKLPAPKPAGAEGAPIASDLPAGDVYVPEPRGKARTEEGQESPEGEPAEQPQQTPEGQAEPPVPPGQEALPPPPPPVEAPREEESGKRYAIQVGLFIAEAGAQQVADQLARGGYPARVEVTRGDGGTLYRVVTGRYRTEYAARKAMEQLRQEGFPGFLVER